MIFVMVGTHEQAFNRLVEYMDNWAANHDERVVIQSGYSDYLPLFAVCQNFYTRDEIEQLIKEADVVITHGGPSSFMQAVELQKKPIVVPRRADLHEHVNNHQLIFSKEFEKKTGLIFVAENVEDIDELIINSKSSKVSFSSNNREFNDRLAAIVEELLV